MSKPKAPRASSPDARTVALSSTGKGLPALIAASKATRYKHQRTIRMSVVLPASVELVVGTDDDDPGEDSDWTIVTARDPRCEVSPRTVAENMPDADFAAMATKAANVEDDDG